MPIDNFARIDASSEDDFKCSRCGAMFATEDRQEAQCPVCGTTCTAQTCRVVGASKEGF